MGKENNEPSNTQTKRCIRCEYESLQDPTKTPDDGLTPVNILSWSPENFKKVQDDPENYKVSVIPTTYSRGTLVIGSMTALNKYGQLKKFAKAFTGMVGPTHVQTRDNKIVIHNDKTNANPKFAYTYAGGTGELLEFTISTKFTQTVTSVKQTSVDPDDKSVNTEVDQGIPTEEESPCQYDMLTRDWTRQEKSEPRNLVDALYMAPKPTRELKSARSSCNVQTPQPKRPIYNSEEEAKTSLANSVVLTEQEVAQYNEAMKNKFNELINVKTEDEYLRFLHQNGNLDDLIIKRKALVYVDPIEYSTIPETTLGGNKEYWKSGYKALQESKDKTIIYQAGKKYRAYNFNPDDWSLSKTGGDRVLVEMDVEIPIPGVRVMSNPNFISQGQAPLSDVLKSVNNQIRADARFVGNPSMESSQNMEIHHVSNRYSGIWYSKEVTHTIDQSGYFTEVIFNKKTQNVVVNRISAKVNTQSIYKETQKIAEESYRTGAWKYPTMIEAIVQKYRKDSWRLTNRPESEDNRQIFVVQNPDPEKSNEYTIYESYRDFETGTPINTREVKKVSL